MSINITIDDWTADSEFIFTQSGYENYFAEFDYRRYWKTNEGKAICASFYYNYYGSIYTCPLLVSTDPNYVMYNASSGGPFSYKTTVVHNDILWYVSDTEHAMGGYASISGPSINIGTYSSLEEAAIGLLDISNARIAQVYPEYLFEKTWGEANAYTWQSLHDNEVRWKYIESDTKYLFSDGTFIFTYTDDQFVMIDGVIFSSLSPDIFINYGINSLPENFNIMELKPFKILKWSNVNNTKIKATLSAVPRQHSIITNDIPLTDATITGVDSILLEYSGYPLFKISFDDGPFEWFDGTSWITGSEFEGMSAERFINIPKFSWEIRLREVSKLNVMVILQTTDDSFEKLTINFLNNI